MENPIQQNNRPTSALVQVQQGDVHMKPKYYFKLKEAALILAIILTFCLTLYTASLVIFIFNPNDALILSRFGFTGIEFLLISLPWFFILLVVGLILLIEFFIKRFTLVYQRPLIYSLLLLVFLMVIGAACIEKMSFHKKLSGMAQEKNIPLLSPFYKEANHMHQLPLHQGMIIEVSESHTLLMQTTDGEKLLVIITPATKFFSGTEFTINEIIQVVGKRIENQIKARGIKKVPHIESRLIFPITPVVVY
jgi:hypothetical protein